MCIIAAEDELSVSVIIRLLKERSIESDHVTVLPTSGNGKLKVNLDKFCNAARNGKNVFILTDLDNLPCAPALLERWFGAQVKPVRLLFRVAVREIETWLMADRKAFAKFLGVSADKIQREVEGIADPKREILKLAEKAKKEVRRDLLSEKNALAIYGFGYNQRLSEFVSNHWCPVRASEASPSLKKAIIRIEAWASDISNKHKVQ